MNKKKVISKGYTLEVKSWENDGDSSQTKLYTVESENEAKRVYKLCKELFKSGNKGIGNSMDGDYMENMVAYVKDNQDLFSDFGTVDSFDDIEDEILVIDYIEELEGHEVFSEIADYIFEVSYKVLGGSDFYDFRVCQSVSVTYSEEDVYLEEIKF
jgi:hypothetical protein